MTTSHIVWLYLKARGDKSEAQIRKACKLSKRKFIFIRRELLNDWRIATVGTGENKVYTVLNIARTK